MEGLMWDENKNYYRFVAITIVIYLTLMFITLCIFVYDVFAQSTEDLIPNADVTEADAVPGLILPMHEVGSVFSGVTESSAPSMDLVVLRGNLPPVEPDNFTLEQLITLRNAQIKYMVEKGILKEEPRQVKLSRARFRNVESDVEVYRYTIRMHDRAIKEGKDYNHYVNEVNSGSPRSAEYVRDAMFCGDSFLLYNDSTLCSKHANHKESERNFAASLDTIEYLNNHYKASVDTINQLLAENAYLKTKIPAKKKGKR